MGAVTAGSEPYDEVDYGEDYQEEFETERPLKSEAELKVIVARIIELTDIIAQELVKIKDAETAREAAPRIDAAREESDKLLFHNSEQLTISMLVEASSDHDIEREQLYRSEKKRLDKANYYGVYELALAMGEDSSALIPRTPITERAQQELSELLLERIEDQEESAFQHFKWQGGWTREQAHLITHTDKHEATVLASCVGYNLPFGLGVLHDYLLTGIERVLVAVDNKVYIVYYQEYTCDHAEEGEARYTAEQWFDVTASHIYYSPEEQMEALDAFVDVWMQMLPILSTVTDRKSADAAAELIKQYRPVMERVMPVIIYVPDETVRENAQKKGLQLIEVERMMHRLNAKDFYDSEALRNVFILSPNKNDD